MYLKRFHYGSLTKYILHTEQEGCCVRSILIISFPVLSQIKPQSPGGAPPSIPLSFSLATILQNPKTYDFSQVAQERLC